MTGSAAPSLASARAASFQTLSKLRGWQPRNLLALSVGGACPHGLEDPARERPWGWQQRGLHPGIWPPEATSASAAMVGRLHPKYARVVLQSHARELTLQP